MSILAASSVRLGQYSILRRLSYGGMSEIYLAYDEREKREVALKVVDMARDDHVQRFQREIEALTMLAHEHILPIFEWGEQDGWYYFAMPYLPRGSLRERLRQGPLTLEEAGSIFDQVASALHYAHERGVLHRDIKPSNILFRDEQFVYLADFGLAKLVEQEGSITQTGCLIGTPYYLAPELAKQDASQRSDIYALGVLLYKMLTGKVPFKGGTAITVCWKHIHEQPVPPSSLNPAIAPTIEHIILQALEKDPADRFSSVRQMAEAYQQALRELKQPKTTRGWSRYFTWKLQRAQAQTEDRFPPTKMYKGCPSLLNGFYHAATAGAMIMILCVAPLYLGFSFYRQNLEPAQSQPGFQVASTFRKAQPFLISNHQHASGEAVSISFALDPGLLSPSSRSLSIYESPSDRDDELSDIDSQASQDQGQKDNEKGQRQLYGGNGGHHHHHHKKPGKRPGD
jgi:serine/threonine protein kinase